VRDVEHVRELEPVIDEWAAERGIPDDDLIFQSIRRAISEYVALLEIEKLEKEKKS